MSSPPKRGLKRLHNPSEHSKVEQNASPYQAYFSRLEEQGFVVIPQVLDASKCDKAQKGLWEWLRAYNPGLHPDRPEAWVRDFPYTMPRKGIVQWYSVGHAPFVWDIRQDPAVHGVFSDLWKDKDLICSFDGICLQLPPELTGKYSDPLGTSWHHSDQSGKRVGPWCYQGSISLEDSDEDDGCFVCRPRSHLLHASLTQFIGAKAQGSSDWVKLQDKDRKWLDENKCPEAIRVPVKRGDMILWDSRTIHANATAKKGRAHPTRMRQAVYVCKTPRKRASQSTLKKRIRYFEQGRMTSHCPDTVHVFSVKPWLRDEKDRSQYEAGFTRMSQAYKPPALSTLGRSLVGYS